MRPTRPPLAFVTLLLAACSSVDASWLGRPIVPGDVPLDEPAVLDAKAPVDAATPADVIDAPVIDASGVDSLAVDAPMFDTPIADATPADRPLAPDAIADVTPPDVATVRCGDRVCSPSESCASCPGDCGACDPCASATSCNACAMMSSCGWCRGTSRCARGTGTGSADGMCSGANWAWQTGDCPAVTDPCLRFVDCRNCASQPACGWCASTGRCLTGNATSPSTGTCAWWVPYATSCGG